eukprot:746662-Hanusia_phi.AAC.1
MKEIDKNNKEIDYLAPKRNNFRRIKEISTDTFNQIDMKDVGGYDKNEIKEGILNFEEWETKNVQLADIMKTKWFRAKNDYSIV